MFLKLDEDEKEYHVALELHRRNPVIRCFYTQTLHILWLT